MSYMPQPFDLSDISVPDQVEALMETLARNTHDVWAKGRLHDGWTHGDFLSAEERTHPSLVAYDQLPEREKEYDRNTARQAIKALLYFGFSITKEDA